VARLIIHIKDVGNKQQKINVGPGMQGQQNVSQGPGSDSVNLLQTLTRKGTIFDEGMRGSSTA